jgi:hypothetical protein
MSCFINRPQIDVPSAADGDLRRYWSDDDQLRIVEEGWRFGEPGPLARTRVDDIELNL